MNQQNKSKIEIFRSIWQGIFKSANKFIIKDLCFDIVRKTFETDGQTRSLISTALLYSHKFT